MKRVSSGRSEFCDNLAERLRRRKEFSDVLYLEGHHTELQSPEHYIGPHGWERLKKICAELGDAVPRMDLTGFLQHLLSRNIRIGVVPVRGHWCEVDSQEDMRCYQQAMNAGNWTHDWRPPITH